MNYQMFKEDVSYYKCTGNRGIRFCADKYPDGMLPEWEFTPSSVESGICKSCRGAMNDVRKNLYSHSGLKAKQYYKLDKEIRDTIYDFVWKDLYLDGRPLKPSIRIPRVVQLAMSILGIYSEKEFYSHPEKEIKYAINIAKDMMEKGENEISAKQNDDKRGSVYIISNPAWEGAIKIGKAFNVFTRLKTYQTYCPRKDYKLECHEFFEDRHLAENNFKLVLNKFHLEGEWFNIETNDAISKLKNLRKNFDDSRKTQ